MFFDYPPHPRNRRRFVFAHHEHRAGRSIRYLVGDGAKEQVFDEPLFQSSDGDQVIICLIYFLCGLGQDARHDGVAVFQAKGHLGGNLSQRILDRLAQDVHFHFCVYLACCGQNA